MMIKAALISKSKNICGPLNSSSQVGFSGDHY
jgi:hypothetical protein